MADSFYPQPPPFPFLGGRQPYTGHDSVPQSGLIPQPAPLAAHQQIIIQSWQDTVWTVIFVDQGVTISGPTPGGDANPDPYVEIIPWLWGLPLPPLPQQSAPIAHFVVPPSVPAPVQISNLRILMQWWDVIPPQPQVSLPVAQLIPAPSAPPKTSFAQLGVLIDSWRPPVWWPLPALNVYPTSAPRFYPQPPMPTAVFNELLDAWKPPIWWPLPSVVQYPVSGPGPAPVPPPSPVGPDISDWTADATHITADSINFTWDGADLINGGGTPIDEKGKGGPAYTVSQTLRF